MKKENKNDSKIRWVDLKKKDSLSDYLLDNFTFSNFLITFRNYYYDSAFIVRVFSKNAADHQINEP